MSAKYYINKTRLLYQAASCMLTMYLLCWYVIYSDMQLGPDGSLAICTRCHEGFDVTEKIVNSGGDVWHPRCFVWV